MRVLVACEESQAVCIEFRKLGHEAYSNDIQECSGGHPEWHLQMDVFEAIKLKEWDLMIAFPPCTHLAVSGAAWFEAKRKDGRQQRGIDFFMALTMTNIPKWAIENPIGIMSTFYRKPDQIIQPWQFGHGETKATCLWLNNLPKLIPTNIVEGREQRLHRLPPSPDRAKLRSKTFPGIAKALAIQYSCFSDSGISLIEWNNIPLTEKNRIFAEYVSNRTIHA
jgi:hypothetical protein